MNYTGHHGNIVKYVRSVGKYQGFILGRYTRKKNRKIYILINN